MDVLTPAGVGYSQSLGGFANTTSAVVASASACVSARVLLRLVEQGVRSLDTQTKSVLTDRTGRPWSGNLADARLRAPMSVTSGIVADIPASEPRGINRIGRGGRAWLRREREQRRGTGTILLRQFNLPARRRP